MMVDNRVEKKTAHGGESGRRSCPLIKRGDKDLRDVPCSTTELQPPLQWAAGGI
jgi:hypothetical protein